MRNKLNFCSWNIHGYNSRLIGNKFYDEEFLKLFEKEDFVGIMETHVHDQILDKMNIPGFHRLSVKNRTKNLKSNTASGGIAVFIREHLMKIFTVVEMENEDAIWVKMGKEVIGGERDLYIGTCYFSPSKGAEREREIAKLTENIIYLNNKGSVIIIGDLNAKIGTLDDTITPDKFDEGFDITIGKPPPRRNSQDNAVNARGNEMLDMCKSLDINIINGRKTGDLFGSYTCFKYNGNSVVDYLLTSASLFQQISYFKVGDFLPWLSDHCPIHFTIQICNKFYSSEPHSILPKIKVPKQFIWSSTGRQKFIHTIKTEKFQQKLEASLQMDYTHPNNVVNHISDVLINAAEIAKVKSTRQKEHGDPPWFNDLCRKLKQDIKSQDIKISPVLY